VLFLRRCRRRRLSEEWGGGLSANVENDEDEDAAQRSTHLKIEMCRLVRPVWCM
jgi:hypothetical protein